MIRPPIPSVREEALDLAREAIEIGLQNRWTHVGWKLARGITAAAHRADEHDFARGAGIAHPVGVAARTDQIALAIEIERVHRKRDRPAALSSADFENVEVAADQADPNQKNERPAKAAFDGARPQILRIIPGHRLLEPAHSVLAMSYSRCSRSENHVVRRFAGTSSASSLEATS